MDIQTLFENNNYIVINKPAGLVVHSDGKTEEPNVAGWFLAQHPEAANVGEPLVLSDGRKIIRPGIVHRIDRETSGVLVIAKTQEAFDSLKKQFQDRQVKKIYNAFVYGEIKNDDGTINRPIGRSKKDFRLWSAQRFARGELREAITDYKVLKRSKEFSFLEIAPKTGRTHQIRAHFKAINYPVVSDRLYAPKRDPALGFSRLALHARSIEFNDLDGKTINVSAPYPEDFIRAESLLN